MPWEIKTFEIKREYRKTNLSRIKTLNVYAEVFCNFKLFFFILITKLKVPINKSCLCFIINKNFIETLIILLPFIKLKFYFTYFALEIFNKQHLLKFFISVKYCNEQQKLNGFLPIKSFFLTTKV